MKLKELKDGYKRKHVSLESVKINGMYYYKVECKMVFSSYKNANVHSLMCEKCRSIHND